MNLERTRGNKLPACRYYITSTTPTVVIFLGKVEQILLGLVFHGRRLAVAAVAKKYREYKSDSEQFEI